MPVHPKQDNRDRRQAQRSGTVGYQPRDLARETGAARQLTQAQRMESISRVSGGIAHNFNNLLTGIIGFCHLLGDASDERSVDRSHLANILSSANDAADLVKQLLAFSQQQIFDLKVFDLNDVVAACEPDLRRLAGEQIEVSIDLESGPGTVHADPKQIERVISNLAANAVQAMPGGGRLNVSTRHLEVYGSSISDFGIPKGRYIVLEVEDTGSGIEEEMYDQIFEPFFSTKKNLNRTGLGLSVAYGIIKQSDGQIRVESSPAHGTRFTIYLPWVEAKPNAAPDTGSTRDSTRPSQPTRDCQTILLAEDDPTVLEVLQNFLTRRGYRVLTASDGAEGVEQSARHDGVIDLLLTDIVMPRMDGLELAQNVLAQRTNIKVLFISGYTQEREVLRELLGDSNAVEFLKKPFEHECLELKLSTLLDPVAPSLQCPPHETAGHTSHDPAQAS